MLLCKVMTDEIDVVYTFLSGKYGLVYKGTDYEAVKAIAAASKTKSLSALKKAEQDFKTEITGD